ncbi:hypothetical protein [Desulfovibrio piger]|uniref:hypothetical protein n=1 Tax=Desulfovibrio piger TaxID=901 RepID=UPI0026EC6733|nr:hypothetical protein [Desulfovibrio piger]
MNKKIVLPLLLAAMLCGGFISTQSYAADTPQNGGQTYGVDCCSGYGHGPHHPNR